MNKVTIYTLLAGLICILLFNFFLTEPTFVSKEAHAEFLARSGKGTEADLIYKSVVVSDTASIDIHYQYISNHFRTFISTTHTHDSIVEFYHSLAQHADPVLSDIGRYGTGLCKSYLRSDSIALTHFYNVKNQNLKYLNHSIGYCLNVLKRTKEAESYFEKEIQLNGNTKPAYEHLALLYRNTHNHDKLEKLMDNPAGWDNISFRIKREFYFYKADFFHYFYASFEAIIDASNMYGFIAAFSILLVWIIYLRRLDIYEEEKWSAIAITLLLGILFAQGTFLLNDVNDFLLGNTLTGNFFNDFIYCFLGIGAVEELVKIIPLLIMLTFTKEINEPIDYIKYASLSAAGFAFTENLMYFQNDALHIIPSRALICVTSHMFYSSIVAYGIMLSKYRVKTSPWITFTIAFIIASFFHGFYDFWLINEGVSAFSQLSLLFFLLSTLMWMLLVNNCLSNSPFYSPEKAINILKFRDYLFSALIGIFIVMFALISVQYGPQEGNKALLEESVIGLIILPIAVRNMSNIRILRYYWDYTLFSAKNLHYDDLIGKSIAMKRTSGTKLDVLKELNGIIMQREMFKNNPNWFLVQLDKPLEYEGNNYHFLLIAPRGYSSKNPTSFIATGILVSDSEVKNRPFNRINIHSAGLLSISMPH